MLRWMYSASWRWALGSTTNFWMTSGYAVPTTREETIMTATPMIGRRQELERTEAMNRIATASPIAARIALAGMTALTSV